MQTRSGYDIKRWYDAFSDAVAAARARAEAALDKTVYSEQGVPVVIPLLPRDGDALLYRGEPAQLMQELLLHTLLDQAARDPAEPTTSEVAHAETLAGMISFSIEPFPAETEAP
jgi:hypothetical protein